jgi:hypothetical protein
MNVQIRVDGEFRHVLPPPRLRALVWQFFPRKHVWTPLAGLNWDDTVGEDISRAAVGTDIAAHTPACIRLVASLATTVFTALYAIERLNVNTAWTNKSRLTIHVFLPSLPTVRCSH